MTHPAVEDAGVIGLPHDVDGELPFAFVVVRAGYSVTAEELVEYTDCKCTQGIRLNVDVQADQLLVFLLNEHRSCYRRRETSRRGPLYRENTAQRSRQNRPSPIDEIVAHREVLLVNVFTLS